MVSLKISWQLLSLVGYDEYLFPWYLLTSPLRFIFTSFSLYVIFVSSPLAPLLSGYQGGASIDTYFWPISWVIPLFLLITPQFSHYFEWFFRLFWAHLIYFQVNSTFWLLSLNAVYRVATFKLGSKRPLDRILPLSLQVQIHILATSAWTWSIA